MPLLGGQIAEPTSELNLANDEDFVSFVARAVLAGIDSSAAPNSQVVPLEARNFDVKADVASTLIGALVNSRPSAFVNGDNWRILTGIADPEDTNRAWQADIPARESGYISSASGRRFIATGQTAGAELTAQAGFVATTPTLMLRQASGATETEVVRSIEINSQAASPTTIKVVIMLDPDDRFSAGGTSVTPQNPNEGSAAVSGITSFLENPTATAADADERIIYNGSFVGGDGAALFLEFKDELILVGQGTLLVYVFDAAGAAAPTITYNVEWEEYT
jgi:hypothetical protein